MFYLPAVLPITGHMDHMYSHIQDQKQASYQHEFPDETDVPQSLFSHLPRTGGTLH